MSTLKSAVIGTGTISEEHLRFCQASSNAALVGVCDLSPAAGRYAAERFAAEGAYTDYRKMLEDARPHVVHVLTPPHTHVALVSDCLRSGAHVICEKPLAPSYGEFRQLCSLARDKGKKLVEDHNYRFNRPILKIEQLIRDGRLGDVQEVEIRMALAIRGEGDRYADANMPHPSHQLPAGVIHEFITHLCYLALRFVPADWGEHGFDQRHAVWSNHGGGDLFKFDDLDALLVVGPVHVRIRFSCHTQPDCFALTVRGDHGYAQTDLFQPHVRCVTPRCVGRQLTPLANQFVNGLGLIGASVANFKRKIMQQTPYEGLHRFLDLTYRALIDGTDLPVTYQDMDRTSRLVEALVASDDMATNESTPIAVEAEAAGS